jgi:hypothetical protein
MPTTMEVIAVSRGSDGNREPQQEGGRPKRKPMVAKKPRRSEDYLMLAKGRRLRLLKPGKRSEGMALGPRATAALRKRKK